MFPGVFLLIGCFIAFSGVLIIANRLNSFISRDLNKLKDFNPVWGNEYPTLEEIHALIDRGDVIFSAVLIASSLQLSHPQLSKVLKQHSTYQTDPWRRIIRTMVFIFIIIRSSSAERQQVIRWLQKLHKAIPIFVFETNVMVFSTFAYGLVKTYELLGDLTAEKKNMIVNGIMSMADKLDPSDNGRSVPCTISQVEEYLRKELSFDHSELLRIISESSRLCSVSKEPKCRGGVDKLRRSWVSVKFFLFKKLIWRLSENALVHNNQSQNLFEKPLWWCVRHIHVFIAHFHYSLCPQVLTLNGTLGLLISANPRLSNVPTELWNEIFGTTWTMQSIPSPSKPLGRFCFSDIQAHAPKMKAENRPLPLTASFREETLELVKCSYYRGLLAQNVCLPQHLGVIMDGNRRYSNHRGFESTLYGHEAGAHKLLQVMSWVFSTGVRNLTVWALSDDNLKRGSQELDPLFSMMAEYIEEILMGNAAFSIPELCFRVVGDRSLLPEYLNAKIMEAEKVTRKNTKFHLQFAVRYGGRSEIRRAFRQAVSAKVMREHLSTEEAVNKITDVDISRQLYSAELGLPPIDAILRTSGENRLSGFALWESHHAEFAIIKENWPALKQSTLLASLLDLSRRKRRFGA